jgi:predicted Kef-type K+ transport protein
MIEQNQTEKQPAQDQDDNGEAVEQGLSKYAGVIGGLLLIAGVVTSLTMALKKIYKLSLWLIPTALYIAAAVFLVKSLGERRAKIESTQEQIVSLMDDLDPVAKLQVADYVAQKELGKK